MKKRNLFLILLSIFMLGMAATARHSILPGSFNSDGAAYFMMTQSMAKDFDLRWSAEDYYRVRKDWVGGPRGVILMTPDQGRNVFYGKPYLSSLFVVPFYLLFKNNAYLFFNTLLLLLMITMAYRFLATKGDDSHASAFAFTFFFASASFAYITWHHPELFNMASIMGAYFLWFYHPPSSESPINRFLRSEKKIYLSAFLMACATFMKPPHGIMVLPFLAYFLLKKRPLKLIMFGLCFALSLFLFSTGQYLTTDTFSAYHSTRRAFSGIRGFPLVHGEDQSAFWRKQETDQQLIADSQDGAEQETAQDLQKKLGFNKGWGTRGLLPFYYHPLILFYDLFYFFFGRHTGLLWYFFPGFMALVYCFSRREDMRRWLLLAAVFATIVFYILLLPNNYQGGGGFVGNRYFVNLYPTLLFLLPVMPRLRWLVCSWIVAGLFISQIFFTPFGVPTRYPSNQTHTRNWVFRHLPFESTARLIPKNPFRRWGDTAIRFLDLRSTINPDQSFFIEGQKKAEILIYSPAKLDTIYFSLVTHANPNEIKISDWMKSATLKLQKDDWKPGEALGGILKFRPSYPYRRHPCFWDPHEKIFWIYNLTLETTNGQRVDGSFRGCKAFFLEKGECLQDDFYGVNLLQKAIPKNFTAGRDSEAAFILENSSPYTWQRLGPCGVCLSYRWLGPDGKSVIQEGPRTKFDRDTPPGKKATGYMTITAPDKPGDYTLQIDSLVEYVAWYQGKRGEPLVEEKVRVGPQ